MTIRNLRFPALVIVGLAVLYFIFFIFCKHDLTLGISNPFGEDPYDAVGSFGVQLSALASCLIIIRLFRPYPPASNLPVQVSLIRRAGTLVLLSVGSTLIADSIGLVREIVANGISHPILVLAGLIGGMMAVTLVACWIFWRFALQPNAIQSSAQTEGSPGRRAVIISVLAVVILAFFPLSWRNSGVIGALLAASTGMIIFFVSVWAIATAIHREQQESYEDIIDDLSAMCKAVFHRWNSNDDPSPNIQKYPINHISSRLLSFINPRRHPWRLVVLVAVAAGLALLLAEAVAEGLSPSLSTRLLVASVYLGLEGAGISLGYLLFVKFLGIFRPD